jgi:hypothetical protein
MVVKTVGASGLQELSQGEKEFCPPLYVPHREVRFANGKTATKKPFHWLCSTF